MTVQRIMGTEVEYGISIPTEPAVNPVISSTHVVLAYAASVAAPRARRPRWDYEVESPSRDARGYDMAGLFGSAAPDPDDIGAANVILSQRRAAVRRPRAPRVLGAGGHQPAGRRDLRQGRRTRDGDRGPAGRRRSWGQARAHVQEQRGRQGRFVRHPRELPLLPGHTISGDRQRSAAVLRLPPGLRRVRPGRHRPAGGAGRLPARAAQRLHRGRGRAGDHPQAGHHQHPRRAARRRRQVPAAARDHRRRQPGRDRPPTSRSAPRRWCSA